MSTFEVELPDGTVIEDIPEGTTQSELIRRLKAAGYDVSWAQVEPAAAIPQDETKAARPLLPSRNQKVAPREATERPKEELAPDWAANTATAAAVAIPLVLAQGIPGVPQAEMAMLRGLLKAGRPISYIAKVFKGTPWWVKIASVLGANWVDDVAFEGLGKESVKEVDEVLGGPVSKPIGGMRDWMMGGKK